MRCRNHGRRGVHCGDDRDTECRNICRKRERQQLYRADVSSGVKDESRAGKYIITPNELESDLAYLSENGYVSVLPSQLVKIREQGGRLPEKRL